MLSILTYAHIAFIALAVVVFIWAVWQQCYQGKTLAKKTRKILIHTHITIFITGVLLVWGKQIDPFASDALWLIEKLGAFIAYSIMVFVALNTETRRPRQILAFIGGFGWLAYMVILATSKHAILLLG